MSRCGNAAEFSSRVNRVRECVWKERRVKREKEEKEKKGVGREKQKSKTKLK